jgi:TolB-like protein/DNA-binding winged helix-turn-helix (wHTH) protein/Flp pilus assembly protein TadD
VSTIRTFGPFRLDVDTEILFRGTEPTALGRRAVALLGVLLERPGAPISKDALIEAAWSGLAVEDSNLTVQISALRRVLGEAGGANWIETMPRRGYRFVGPPVVTEQNAEVAEPPLLAAGVNTTAAGQALITPLDRPIRGGRLIEVWTPTDSMQQRGGANGNNLMLESVSAPRLSIVVLPFTNIGGDPEQEYFVDGVTESLTTDLSRIAGSFVIARNTAFTFKGRACDVKQVGRELNVRYALEGSVQRSGNRLRINVQLVDADTGTHLWADRFDKPITDLFGMQDEIVARLAFMLNAQLIEVEARRAERSPHPDAMELVFQGKSCWHKGMTSEHMAQAKLFFQRALVLDPGNIDALVGVAAVDAGTALTFMVDDRETRLAAAEATLIEVLSVSPRHARAHMYLGAVYLGGKRSGQAIPECEQALALDRNLADAHAIIGLAKLFIGRGAETQDHIHQTLRLSPRDPAAFRWMHYLGAAKLVLGADDEAVEWLRRSLVANRNNPNAQFQLAAALALLGALDEARDAVRAGLALDPTFTINRMRGLALSGDPTFRSGSRRVRDGMRLAGVPEE